MTMRDWALDLHRALDNARASGLVVVELMEAVQEVIDLMAATLQAHRAGDARLSPRALLQLAADMGSLARIAADTNQVIRERLSATSAHIEWALDCLPQGHGEHDGVADVAAALNQRLVALAASHRAIQRNEQRVMLHVEALVGLAQHLETPAEVNRCVGDLLRRLRKQMPPH